MTYYLEYRPQKISELDIEQVRTSLTEILSKKTFPHAWLFSGPKGTGKTSSARIVAKAVNCLSKKNPPEPCNRCDICQSITKGTALDVIEIDAASNRGIDDIRELKDKIRLSPARLKYKVYIIDEVHMLTTEAFNALLKTLEEPPQHAIFILCTTEPEKLPATVVSRCLQIRFNQASPAELTRSLKRVVKGEDLKIEAEDLAKIAEASGGSFRDAVKLLEELAAAGKKITSAKVDAKINSGVNADDLDKWLELVYTRQTKAALDWLQQAWQQGASPRRLMLVILERLRQVLLLKLGVVKAKDLAAIDNIEELRQLIRIFLDAATRVKTATIESLPLELAVVTYSQAGATPAVTPTAPPQPKIDKSQPEIKSETPKIVPRSMTEKWQKILEEIKPLNHSLEALLKATEPISFDDDWLTVRVFYKFHKERLEDERYRKMVESVASKVLVCPVKIKLVLSDKPKTASNLVEVDSPDIIKTAEEIFGIGGD
jgi:DNA polymerase-3 subunit gamma/tau